MPRNTNPARFPAEELDEAELAETLEQPAEMPDETDAELADEIVEEEAQEEETLDEETDQIDRSEPEQEMPPFDLHVRFHGGSPADNIAATADVQINGFCTIQNVKIKNDDYGLEVVMPRTKLPDTGHFRDACVFATREMRNQFDMAVLSAYQQQMGMTQTQEQPEQEYGMGMHM